MTVRIERQFNGPPESGNGGYVAGLMGDALTFEGSICFETSLKAPPPLDTPLSIIPFEDGIALMEGEKPVVTAKALADFDLALPAFPERYKTDTPKTLATGFDSCFVCGVDRTPGDGLCLYSEAQPGPSDQWIAAFDVDPAFCDEHGTLKQRFLVAALDCPGFAAVSGGVMAVLARFKVKISGSLKRGEAAEVYAWPISHAGRKMVAGTAVLSRDREVVACAEALWIKISPDQLRAAK